MQLTHGFKYLEYNPTPYWKYQYTQRLDHYSFGVMVAEVFFALWMGPIEFQREVDKSPEMVRWRENLEKAVKAWRTFWTTAVSFFQRFHRQGATGIRHYLRVGHIHTLAEQLFSLCGALREAANCAPEGDLYRSVSVVLKSIAELIDPKSTFKWQELQQRLLEFDQQKRERRASRLSRRRASSASSEFEVPAELPQDQGQAVSSPSGGAGKESSEEEELGPAQVDMAEALKKQAEMADTLADAQAEATPPPRIRRGNHRRVWTMDYSLTRGPEPVDVGITSPTAGGGASLQSASGSRTRGASLQTARGVVAGAASLQAVPVGSTRGASLQAPQAG
jgi:hypothetical protein